MKLLAIVSEPISAKLLRSVAGGLAGDAEVLVVAPATIGSPLRFWVSDVDDAIEHAENVTAESVERLEEGGIDAAGEVGDSELLVAVEDALATFRADRIALFVHEPGKRDYREGDGVAAALHERFGLPVDAGTVGR